MSRKKEVSPGDPEKRHAQVPRSGSRTGNIITLFILAVLLVSVLGSPVSAHTAAEMGIAADQYDKGIPVYWPYHALLMAGGFILLASGSLVMRYGKKPSRFRIHRFLQVTGAGAVIAGLGVAAFMVTLSGAPHFRYFHDQLGAGIVLLVMISLLIGFSLIRSRGRGIRTVHRWTGWVSVVLMVLNIILGISMMAMVLAQ